MSRLMAAGALRPAKRREPLSVADRWSRGEVAAFPPDQGTEHVTAGASQRLASPTPVTSGRLGTFSKAALGSSALGFSP